MTQPERNPKFSIGQKFTSTFGKRHSVEYTVTDIYFTRNLVGALIKLEYQTEHSLAGQSIHELVCETTIARALAVTISGGGSKELAALGVDNNFFPRHPSDCDCPDCINKYGIPLRKNS